MNLGYDPNKGCNDTPQKITQNVHINNVLINNNANTINDEFLPMSIINFGQSYANYFLNNVTIANNTCYNNYAHSTTIRESSLVNKLDITNIIMWNNISYAYQINNDYSAPLNISNSNIEGGMEAISTVPSIYVNNINSDPLFLSESNYHLSCVSPCLNSGDHNLIPEWIDYDIEGNNRILDGEVDMGAYETEDPNTAITSQPQDITACIGENFSLSIEAAGNGTITYQWYKDDNLIIGATNSTYQIISCANDDAGEYFCIVTSDCGSVTSNIAILTVAPLVVITTQPENATVCNGTDATFTIVADNANSYQWQFEGSDISGANSATLFLAGVTDLDAGNYTCNITGDCGNVTSDIATLIVNPLTIIITQPTDQSACIGGDATFTVEATGTGVLNYQWQFNGSDIAGANSATLFLTGITGADVGNYTCQIGGICGDVTSNIASLIIIPPPVAPTSVSATETNISAGESTILSYSGGSGTTFVWYTESCGDVYVGEADEDGNLTVFPEETTTYFGRWENECGVSTCQEITINVDESFEKFNLLYDENSHCANEQLTFVLDGSVYGVPYYLVRDGEDEWDDLVTGRPDGGEITLRSENLTGTYRVFAYFEDENLKTEMNNFYVVESDNILPLPPTDFNVTLPNYSTLNDFTTVTVTNTTEPYEYAVYTDPYTTDYYASIENSVDIEVPSDYLHSGLNEISVIVQDPNTGCTDTVDYGDICIIDGVLLEQSMLTGSDEFVNQAYFITEDIVLQADNSLSFSNCQVTFGNNAQIIVSPESELDVINSSILTNANECTTQPWKGIFVSSNIHKNGSPTNYGIVNVFDSEIRNAQTGVKSATGGVIIAKNSQFTNNYNDIRIENYWNPYKNCLINENTFESTDDFYSIPFVESAEMCRIYLNNATTVEILGNDFICPTSTGNFIRNTNGIISYNTDLSVEPYIIPGVGLSKNTFTNFYTGIKIFEDGLHSIKIDNNVFTDNTNSISVSGCAPVIIRNEFNIPYYPSYMKRTATGVFMVSCSNYQVEENDFIGENWTRSFGLVVRNSGITPNEIYNNNFSNLYMACQAQGINGTRDITVRKGGLQFLCNTFDNNAHNIFVTEYVPEQDITIDYSDELLGVDYRYGIAEYQGSYRESAGNKFLNEYKYDITNKQASFYYCYDKELNSKPRMDIIGLDQNVYPILVKKANNCPSHLHSTEPSWSELYNLKDSVTTKQESLNNLIDAGNTEDVLYEISNATPEQANKLTRNLLAISPSVSDTSMVNSIEIENVLPPVMLAQVLTSNPRASKSGKVLYALTNRKHPLPPPFMEDIMEFRDSLSHHEAIASDIGSFMSEKNRTLNEIKRSSRNDTLSVHASDSLILLLTTDNSLQSDYMLISYYLYLSELENAEQVLLEIPQKYELSNLEEREYQGMLQITNIQIDLFSQDKTYEEIDSIQKQTLFLLSEDTIIRAGAIARNILTIADTVQFTHGVVIPIIDTTSNKGGSDELPKLSFELSPNPAKEYFVVDYQLPEKTFKNAEFVMYNNNNQKVYSQKITRYWYQLLVETGKINPGYYLCKLMLEGKELDKKGILIKPDQMSPYEISNAEKLYYESLNEGDKTLVVYPNPAEDYVNAEFNVNENATITLVDNSGKVIITENVAKNSSQLRLNTSNLSSGIYTVNLIVNGEIISSKTLIKQ